MEDKEGTLEKLSSFFESSLEHSLSFLCECLIAACSRAGDVNMAFKLYGELTQAGLKADCQVHNVLLSTCAEAMKCRNLERREQLVLLERAFSLFEDMEASNLQPDTSNWNTLICCAARAGQLLRAFEVGGRLPCWLMPLQVPQKLNISIISRCLCRACARCQSLVGILYYLFLMLRCWPLKGHCLCFEGQRLPIAQPTTKLVEN